MLSSISDNRRDQNASGESYHWPVATVSK